MIAPWVVYAVCIVALAVGLTATAILHEVIGPDGAPGPCAHCHQRYWHRTGDAWYCRLCGRMT